MSNMDKIAGLKEILALDAKNSFARYGIAMELAGRGETDEALKEFDALLANDPDYTAGYFMSAQTLANAGRKAEAIERLKAGIGCAARTGNRHALSEMQAHAGRTGSVASSSRLRTGFALVHRLASAQCCCAPFQLMQRLYY